MIGQVAALRDEPTTIADLHARRQRGRRPRCLDAVARRRRASERRDRGPARWTSPSSAWPACSRARPTSTSSGPTSSAGSTRSPRCPPDRWDADRYYDPEAAATGTPAARPRRSGAGSCPTSPFDPLRYGIPPALAGVDRAGAAARLEVAARRARRRRLRRPRRSTATRTSVIFGAEAGTDLARRLRVPRRCCRTSSATCPTELDEHLPEAHRGLVPRRARQRHRRAHRQPPRPRRRQLHRRRRLRLLARRARRRLQASCVGGASDMVLCGGADLHNGIYDYLLFAVGPRAVAHRPVPHLRRRRPTASPSARAWPASCSSGSPTPSATATASTP